MCGSVQLILNPQRGVAWRHLSRGQTVTEKVAGYELLCVFLEHIPSMLENQSVRLQRVIMEGAKSDARDVSRAALRALRLAVRQRDRVRSDVDGLGQSAMGILNVDRWM